MGDKDVSSWVPFGFSLLSLLISVVSLFFSLLGSVKEGERRKDALINQSQESLQLLSRDTYTLWQHLDQHNSLYRCHPKRIQAQPLVFEKRDAQAWRNRILLADGCKAAFAMHPHIFGEPGYMIPQVGQMENGKIRVWDVKELACKIVEHQWKAILRENRSTGCLGYCLKAFSCTKPSELDDQQKYTGFEVFCMCLPIYVADWLHGYREKHLRDPDGPLMVQAGAWEQSWDARDRNGELRIFYNIAETCEKDSQSLIADAIYLIHAVFGLQLPEP